MAKIHILPERIANKIAAGEVVERPASVVKEIVENSIDAEATQILVEVSASGTGLIRVSDNGYGMEPEDAKLAFERHATSKIHQVEDLWAIQTMGFRGEALPSIAAVARVTMVSKTQEANVATRLVIEAGQVKEVTETGAPAGTVVEVRDLFYNTPARLKFLKSDTTEFGHISHIVTQLALAHPEIDFRLRHQGKIILELPVTQDRRERIALLFGRELAQELILIQQKSSWGEVVGQIAGPGQTRANRSGEYYFVNRRAITNRTISHAVMEGYHTLLPSRRYPVLFLFISASPELVDVNVHPTKREVKFQKESQIHDDLVRIIRNAFQKTPLALAKSNPREEYIHEAIAEYVTRQEGENRETIVRYETGKAGIQKESKAEVDSSAYLYSPSVPHPKVIGQLRNTYIIAEDEQGVILYDQHTVNERIRYERLMAQFQRAPLESQPILFPIAVEVNPREATLWQGNQGCFQKLGFEIEPFGGQTLMIRSAPAVLNKVDLKQFLSDLSAELVLLENTNKDSIHWLPEEVIKTIACRSSVMAGESLERSQLQLLVDQLGEVKVPQTCPHGRATTWRIAWEEIEKKFRR